MCTKFVVGSCFAAMASVSIGYDFAGNDWAYNFQGQYTIANTNANNLSVVAAVIGTSLDLTAQLNLINGTTSASGYATSISQSSLSSISVNDLRTSASAGPGLVPTLGTFVFNLLDFSDGVYTGTVVGTDVALTEGSLITADLFALVDSRLAGTGVVLDLRAAVPTSMLHGTLTGINSGVTGAFGDRAFFVDGDAGIMQTIQLEARARTFVAGISTVDTGYLSVGAIVNSATDWNLSRNPVPEPTSMAALSLGLLLFRRKAARKRLPPA
jgi:hypothetical protein